MIKMKQIKQTIGKIAVISCLAFAGYSILSGTYQAGVKQGLEEAEQRSLRERIVLTHTGYEHLADRDYDGKFDILRQVKCGQDVSDVLYVRDGHGPAQSVDSVVKVVEDDFFKDYNTETLKEAITVK
jgi:hypothetical protein